MTEEAEEEEDPLRNLFVDKDELNREKLYKALDGIVGIASETGEIVRREGFEELNSSQRIVAVLLAQKAATLVNAIDESEEGLNSSELAEISGVAPSTVRRYASEKIDFVSKDKENGGYIIQDYEINRAVEWLRQGT